MSWRSFVSVLIAGALFGLYIGAIVQHGYEATRAARAYQRGYAAAVDSVKAIQAQRDTVYVNQPLRNVWVDLDSVAFVGKRFILVRGIR